MSENKEAMAEKWLKAAWKKMMGKQGNTPGAVDTDQMDFVESRQNQLDTMNKELDDQDLSPLNRKIFE